MSASGIDHVKPAVTASEAHVRPRVTVCMPTRNRAHWLGESIASVLEQSFDSLVLLVSDNASTDATGEVVRSFSDPRVTYARQPHDVGLVVNHNQLLERVESEYVITLPDDDLMGPELLEPGRRHGPRSLRPYRRRWNGGSARPRPDLRPVRGHRRIRRRVRPGRP